MANSSKKTTKRKTLKKPETKIEKIKKSLTSEKNLKTAKNIATFASAAASVIALLKTTGIVDKITGSNKQERTINEILTQPQQNQQYQQYQAPEYSTSNSSMIISPPRQQSWMPSLPWTQQNQQPLTQSQPDKYSTSNPSMIISPPRQQSPWTQQNQQLLTQPYKNKSFWSWD